MPRKNATRPNPAQLKTDATEYDIADPKAWGFINRIAAEAMRQGTFHIIGTPDEG